MIGVFDSGLGGLTILKHFLKDLPEYEYMYLGDNARVPYGNKSQESIYEYTKQAVDFLFSQDCELIIIACNSASSRALRRIQQEYLPKKYPGKKVLGVIIPLVQEAVKQGGRIGVIGTKATINSGAYTEEIHKLDKEREVYTQSAPLLVPLIEEGWSNYPETKKILKKYLRPLKDKKVHSLILACTHYQFLLKQIKHIMPKDCIVFNPGEVITKSLADYLARHSELNISKVPSPRRIYYTTDDIGSFKKLGEKFLGCEMGEVKKVDLN